MANMKPVLVLAILALGSIHVDVVSGYGSIGPADCVTPYNDCTTKYQSDIDAASSARSTCYQPCGYCTSYDNSYNCNDTTYLTCKCGCDATYNSSLGAQYSAQCQTAYSKCMKDNPSCSAKNQDCITAIGAPLEKAQNDSYDCNNDCWGKYCVDDYLCYSFTNYTDCTTACQVTLNATKAQQDANACYTQQDTCNFACTILNDKCNCACDDKYPTDQTGNANCKTACQNQYATCSWIQDYGNIIWYGDGGEP